MLSQNKKRQSLSTVLVVGPTNALIAQLVINLFGYSSRCTNTAIWVSYGSEMEVIHAEASRLKMRDRVRRSVNSHRAAHKR
jgi:hypothetical protein